MAQVKYRIHSYFDSKVMEHSNRLRSDDVCMSN